MVFFVLILDVWVQRKQHHDFVAKVKANYLSFFFYIALILFVNSDYMHGPHIYCLRHSNQKISILFQRRIFFFVGYEQS